ncbi:hypothetical protein CEXT_49171 [Caerostris extrusa]|uniref:Uncharacterized protein n=1 Tax=Caerostris extrusa TaxID=172846 RepID=A0AAV4XXK8_CAEEX|nr:hypothetical protein CEXT_49171 [Caerostris extrusa]
MTSCESPLGSPGSHACHIHEACRTADDEDLVTAPMVLPNQAGVTRSNNSPIRMKLQVLFAFIELLVMALSKIFIQTSFGAAFSSVNSAMFMERYTLNGFNPLAVCIDLFPRLGVTLDDAPGLLKKRFLNWECSILLVHSLDQLEEVLLVYQQRRRRRSAGARSLLTYLLSHRQTL